jgi:glutathione S-transferase
MIALGLEHQVRDLVPKFEAMQKENQALQAKIQTYERERAAGLPSSTARAGTTSGQPAAGEAKSFADAAMTAWVMAGGRPEDYR